MTVVVTRRERRMDQVLHDVDPRQMSAALRGSVGPDIPMTEVQAETALLRVKSAIASARADGASPRLIEALSAAHSAAFVSLAYIREQNKAWNRHIYTECVVQS